MRIKVDVPATRPVVSGTLNAVRIPFERDTGMCSLSAFSAGCARALGLSNPVSARSTLPRTEPSSVRPIPV